MFKFDRKTPVTESVFDKAAALKACNFIKKNSNSFFPMKSAKLSRTPILKSICKRLLLTFGYSAPIGAEYWDALKQRGIGSQWENP